MLGGGKVVILIVDITAAAFVFCNVVEKLENKDGKEKFARTVLVSDVEYNCTCRRNGE